jgi:hypothetical protein
MHPTVGFMLAQSRDIAISMHSFQESGRESMGKEVIISQLLITSSWKGPVSHLGAHW